MHRPSPHRPIPRRQRSRRQPGATLSIRLENVGLRAYAVDHSRPDVLLRTVRAIVPGLRHVWKQARARTSLRRSREEMAWLTRPNTESDMNPIPGML